MIEARNLHWQNELVEGGLVFRQLCIRADVIGLDATSVEFPRDGKDVPILATLEAAGADALIRGNCDLLQSRRLDPIRAPAESIRRL